MATLVERLAQHGIHVGKPPQGLRHLKPGKQHVVCPRCSGDRKKKNAACLTVEIDDKGAKLTCYHCGWHTAFIASDSPGGQAERPPPKPGRQPPKQLTPNEKMLAWFQVKRAISKETVLGMQVYFGTGWFPQLPDGEQRQPAIVFPYLQRGTIVNNKYRTSQKHFSQDSGAAKVLYNYDSLIEAKTVIWCEGEIDVLAVIEAGAAPDGVGVTTLPDGSPPKHKDEIDPTEKRYQPIADAADILEPVKRHIIATDGDEKGDNLAYQVAHRLGLERCFRVYYPNGCKDLDEVLNKHGAEAVRACLRNARGWPLEGVVEIAPGQLSQYRKSPKVVSYGTGVKQLDPYLKLRPQQLCVITGFPTDGKTEVWDWIMVLMARSHGWKWCVCSPEHQVEQHAAKLAEKYAEEPFYDWGPHHPAMSEAKLESAESWVARHFSFLYSKNEDAPMTLDFVLAKVRAMWIRYRINGFDIDPWNELFHQDRKNFDSIDEYITHQLMRVKQFSRNHHLLGTIIAHPKKIERDYKSGKRPVPTLHDISGSAAWWAKADVGLVVYRPSHEENDSRTHLIVSKMKDKTQGREGLVELFWQRYTGLYRPSEAKKANGEDKQDDLPLDGDPLANYEQEH